MEPLFAVLPEEVTRDAIRAELAGVAIRMNGQACQTCGLVVSRYVESPNTCWSTQTNSESRFVGVPDDRAGRPTVLSGGTSLVVQSALPGL